MTEGRADLHIHTSAGDGMLTVSQVLDQAEELGLTALAITDHDNVAPSLGARELAAKKRLNVEVVTGAEITTRGFRHLLALNIEENIPFGLPLLEAIRRIHGQGGLVVAAHPLVPVWPASLREKEIFSVLFCPDREVYFDGFEVINGSIKNKRTRGFYEQYLAQNCASVAGSDAHFRMIGKAVTVYPKELGIVAAIKKRRTAAVGTDRPERLVLTDIILNSYRALIKEPIRRGRVI